MNPSPSILLGFMNLKRNFDLIHFLWKRTFHLANRLPWWHAGSDACTHNKLHECGWEVGIMMADPDIKSFGAISAKIQLRELFVIKCRNSHSHQFICTQSHLATSVSITMATHCYSLRSPEAIRRCPLSFPPPFFFVHFFLWHRYSFAFLPSVSQSPSPS